MLHYLGTHEEIMARSKKPAYERARKSDIFKVRMTPAQKELIYSCGTASTHRQAMIDNARSNLDMNVEYGNVEYGDVEKS